MEATFLPSIFAVKFGVFLRTGGQNECPFSQYFLFPFLIFAFPKFSAATIVYYYTIYSCVLRCITAVESLVIAVVLNLAIQTTKFKTALKESYPVEPLRLKAKSEMPIFFVSISGYFQKSFLT